MNDWNADDTAFEDDDILSKELKPDRVRLMNIAEGLTMGDRNVDYGDPFEGLDAVAQAFNSLTGKSISASDIALIYTLGKFSRIKTSPLKEDNYVDAIAYAGIMYECAKAQKK